MEKKPIRSLFLFGEFELTIDSKNRLLLPSDIRHQIVPEFHGEFLFGMLRNKIPFLYPERYYRKLVSTQVRPDLAPNDDLLDYTQMKFALVSKIDWDSQGRITMPEKLMKRSSLAREVTLIGHNDHIEIYNRDAWELRAGRLIDDSVRIETRGKAELDKQALERARAAGNAQTNRDGQG